MQTVEQTWAGKNSFAVSGRYFRLLSCVNAVDIVFFMRGQKIGEALGFDAGLAADGLDFDRIELTTAGEENVKFIISNSPIRYDRLSGDVQVTNTAGPYTNSRATVLSSGVTLLLAADANRRYVLVQNNDAAVALRVTMDGVDPTTAQGVRVPAGGSYECPPGFAPTGAIKAIAESGAGCAVEVVKG
jgi:hypothetical protein